MLNNKLIIVFYFAMTTAVVQRNKNLCVYKSLTQKDKQEETLSRYQPIYEFRKGEKIASIGAGGGSKEVIYSMMADSLTVYLQDINPICLSPDIVQATVSQLYQAAGRTCTATFTPVIGTGKETRLPSQFFDAIIMENTLHELTYPGELVASIRANLKPDGCFYIEDFIAKRAGQKHRGCHKPSIYGRSVGPVAQRKWLSSIDVYVRLPEEYGQ